MRTKKIYKGILVEEKTYDLLQKDRKKFQKVIGGGAWSINDTIKEYHKIIKLAGDQK